MLISDKINLFITIVSVCIFFKGLWVSSLLPLARQGKLKWIQSKLFSVSRYFWYYWWLSVLWLLITTYKEVLWQVM